MSHDYHSSPLPIPPTSHRSGPGNPFICQTEIVDTTRDHSLGFICALNSDEAGTIQRSDIISSYISICAWHSVQALCQTSFGMNPLFDSAASHSLLFTESLSAMIPTTMPESWKGIFKSQVSQCRRSSDARMWYDKLGDTNWTLMISLGILRSSTTVQYYGVPW